MSSCEKWTSGICKNHRSGQPALSAQAELSQYFLLLVNYLYSRGQHHMYLIIHLFVKTVRRMSEAKT